MERIFKSLLGLNIQKRVINWDSDPSFMQLVRNPESTRTFVFIDHTVVLGDCLVCYCRGYNKLMHLTHCPNCGFSPDCDWCKWKLKNGWYQLYQEGWM